MIPLTITPPDGEQRPIAVQCLLGGFDEPGQPAPPRGADGDPSITLLEDRGLGLGHEIRLVEHQTSGGGIELEVPQETLDGALLLLEPLVGSVDDVQEQVRIPELLQGGPKGRDQVPGQVGDETHGVGDDDLSLSGEAQAPAGGIEGHEELVARGDVAVGEGVQQGGLPGVGVADDGQDRDPLVASTAPAHVALARELADAALESADPVPDASTADLHHRLARAAAPDASRETGQAGILLRQPRQRVLELRQLDLKLAVGAAGPLGEDVEDELCAIDGLEPSGVLEGSSLGRLEIDVEDGDRCPPPHPLEHDLEYLASADHRLGMDPEPLLLDAGRHLDAGRLGQLQDLLEPTLVRGDADDEGPFPLRLARRLAADPRELLLERSDLRAEVELEGVDAPGLDPAKGLGMALGEGGRGDHGDLDATWEAVRARVDHGHQVETQQGQVVQVVGRERLAPQVGVDQPQAAEAPHAASQAPDVREGEVGRVADDDAADQAVPAEQHTDLPADLAGDLGEVSRQLGRDHVLSGYSAAVRALERAALGCLDPTEVAFELGNGSGSSSDDSFRLAHSETADWNR